MKYSMPILALMAMAAMLQLPHTAHGQSKELKSLQSYIYDVQHSMDKLNETQNERLTALEAQFPKVLAAIEALSAKLDKMQQDNARALAEQQTRVAEPVTVLRSSVDQVTQNVSGLQATQASVGQRLTAMEQQLSDIKQLLQLLQTANEKPDVPPPAIEDSPIVLASKLFESAVRDYNQARDEFAMQEFRELVEKYPASPDAPQAYIYIGLLFDRAKQYPDAVTAYERVLTLFPTSDRVSEAMFNKAESLRLAGKKADAQAAFRAFLQKFPNDPKKGTAEEKLRTLR